jgi:hypothetical protein
MCNDPSDPASGDNSHAHCDSDTESCPQCEYWNQDHVKEIDITDDRYRISSQTHARRKVYRLEGNLACAVQVVFSNESGHPIKAPLDEIGNGLVLVYSVDGIKEPLIDNEIPPPPNDGSVVTLTPGESHAVRLSFSYPQPLMPEPFIAPVGVKFCVRWQKEWLRAKTTRRGLWSGMLPLKYARM